MCDHQVALLRAARHRHFRAQDDAANRDDAGDEALLIAHLEARGHAEVRLGVFLVRLAPRGLRVEMAPPPDAAERLASELVMALDLATHPSGPSRADP
jgi:hypothetical protein